MPNLKWSENWEMVEKPNSPYAAWWNLVSPLSQRSNFMLVSQRGTQAGRRAFFGTARKSQIRELNNGLNDEFDGIAPIRANAVNPLGPQDEWMPDGKKLPKIGPDSVITVVIDSGVPLHHANTQRGGKTRILASWQQNAPHVANDSTSSKDQDYLPFGYELYQDGIDKLLCSHTKPDGVVDEMGFNQEARLIDVTAQIGPRDLMRRVSHGAAVLDTAAGATQHLPGDIDPAKVYIIAVNLPDRETMGLSGEFLDYFTSLAVQRAVDLADKIWEISKATWEQDQEIELKGREGFPIIVSLAYGKNAGQKDGSDIFNQTCQKIISNRDPVTRPLHVVVPVGNDNLEQGKAKIELDSGEADAIIWELLPEDQSNNYLEIWSSPVPVSEIDQAALKVEIGNPKLETGFVVATPKIGGVQYLYKEAQEPENEAIVAALYLRQWNVPNRPDMARLQYVLCTLPTLDQSRPKMVVPSGKWEILITNTIDQRITASLMVQTDQSPLPNGKSGLQSKLIDPARTYQVYDVNGRVRDSYSYPFIKTPHDLDTECHVQRHETMNATATAAHIIGMAGHREVDGKPANYSSTGHRRGVLWGKPRASLPVEDGVLHQGRIVSGASDGSVVRLGGTSFATALAVRQISAVIVENLKTDLSGQTAPTRDIYEWLKERARHEDPCHPDKLPEAKIGAGRLSGGPNRRLARFEGSRKSWLDNSPS